ncbi:MAG: alpha/beta hydrolase [Spirosomaceae bacterium]|nr:alpha/beta hydrolase [Spirosomataceae bacterium]
MSLRFYITFLGLICGSIATLAQQLPRRGSLGIEAVQAPDSLLKALRAIETKGIWVKNVKPQSTAAALGIQADDVLVAINDTDSLYLFDFQQLDQNLKANEPISVTLLRGRRKSRVVGFVMPAPKETSLQSEVIYSELPFYRQYLRTIINKPASNGRFPAILFMQDAPCTSIDFSKDTLHPIKQLVDGWARAGFVVMRVERSGIGESVPGKAASRLTFQDDMLMFENAYQAIRQLQYVDSSSVFLFGQGTGASMASILTTKTKQKPRGVMVFGAVVKPWFEYMIDVHRVHPLVFKESYQSIEVNTRMLTPLLYEWLVGGKTSSTLMENPDFEAILTSNENPLQYHNGTMMGRTASFFPDLNRQNLPQVWGQVGVPTLAMHGEYDLKTVTPEAAQTIAQIVNENKPQKGTYKLLKNTDHSLLKVSSFEESLKARYPFFNSEIVETTVEWMKKQ